MSVSPSRTPVRHAVSMVRTLVVPATDDYDKVGTEKVLVK